MPLLVGVSQEARSPQCADSVFTRVLALVNHVVVPSRSDAHVTKIKTQAISNEGKREIYQGDKSAGTYKNNRPHPLRAIPDADAQSQPNEAPLRGLTIYLTQVLKKLQDCAKNVIPPRMLQQARAHLHRGVFPPTSNASCLPNSQHACKLSRPTHETSDRTTNARRPADPTERPTHPARRTTAQRPSRGARAAASTRGPCEHCGAPERCQRPPGRGQGGAGGQQGLVAGQPCDTVRGARQSCPDARARNTTG